MIGGTVAAGTAALAGAGLTVRAASANLLFAGIRLAAVARVAWSSFLLRVCFLREDLAAACAFAPGLPAEEQRSC